MEFAPADVLGQVFFFERSSTEGGSDHRRVVARGRVGSGILDSLEAIGYGGSLYDVNARGGDTGGGCCTGASRRCRRVDSRHSLTGPMVPECSSSAGTRA
jgi:hypothetical protein